MTPLRTVLVAVPALAVLVASSTAPSLTDDATIGQPVVRSGTVSGWSIDATGTVAVRLAGKHDGEPFELWFATPPNRTSTIGFEALVLDAVLESSSPTAPIWLTAHSERNEGSSGASVDRAFPLLALRHE